MSELDAFHNKFKTSSLKIFETSHWLVSLRPTQPTIGSVILTLKRSCSSLSELTPEEGADFPLACEKIERLLRNRVEAVKFNYLALMMVDGQVHYHVIPRSNIPFVFNGQEYIDTAWPKPVDIFYSIDIEINALLEYLVIS